MTLASAALALALLASGPADAGAATAAATSRPGAARVLLFGDFGDRGRQQRAVAAAMGAAHARAPFDLGFALGDNLYDCGPDVTLPGAEACRFLPDANTVDAAYVPPDDPRFSRQFEEPLAALGLPIHPALGNHDVSTAWLCRPWSVRKERLARTRACLEVARRSPRWTMPGRHYVVDAGPARFVVLDTNLVRGEYGGFSLDDEVAFLAAAAAGAGGRTLFVVAHHPAATAGAHDEDFAPERRARLERLVAAGGGRIAAWFAGHDHDLQHLRAPAGFDVFVSGSAARERGDGFGPPLPEGAALHFGSTAWGFATLEIEESGWSVTFEDDRNRPLHCCRAHGSGPCAPAPCDPR